MEVLLKRVCSDRDVSRLAMIADDIWHEYFISILTEDQIDYMIDKFQSIPAMTKQMVNEGYEYYFIVVNGEEVGYTGIKKDVDKLFLSKLYLQREQRGKGYASAVFEQLKEISLQRDLNTIWLTVNRNNEGTISIYKRKGFEVICAQVKDIGEGYVMDDYVMEWKLM